MKIAIDARGINWYNGTGIGTYTENVLKNLINIDKNNNYRIYWSGENYDNFIKDNTKIIMASKKHQRFFQDYYFPANIINENIDIFHIPQNGIGLNININCKKIVTIHDLIPYTMPETVGKGYLLKFLKEMPLIIENSDAILTVSEFSKKDILKFFPIDENKIFVTPLAADKKYTPLDKNQCRLIIKDTYNITTPFILYLGGFSDRKNVDSIITSFATIYKDLDEEYSLVLVGSYRDSSQKLVKLSEELNIRNNVIFTGFVPEEHLPFFYNACTAFVYPSLYEGFGLPPLEAMNCGTPVITSNLTSIPEVVDESGILVNPHDSNALSHAIGNLLCNKTLLNELSIKSLERASMFSWKKTAESTLKVYETIYEQI